MEYLTPTVRPLNAENNSTITRKPGNISLMSARKPFVDRAVNCSSPNRTPYKEKLLLLSPLGDKKVLAKSTSNEEDAFIAPWDCCSLKEADDEDEVFLLYKPLNHDGIHQYLENYFAQNTPPPSPVKFECPALVELPESEFTFKYNEDNDDFMNESDFSVQADCDIPYIPSPDHSF